MSVHAYVTGAALASILALPMAARGEALRELCPDRPGKVTSPCTVDAGHVQVEADLFDFTHQRAQGIATDTYVVANPTWKFGVTDRWDIEANLVPYVSVRSRDGSTGQTQALSGVGDLFLRTKVNLAGNGGGDFSVAVDPFLKLPTARPGIGNGAIEAGFPVPLSLDLGGGWSLASTPELDFLRNVSGNGRHLDAIGVFGLGRALPGGVTVGTEFWSSTDLDPAGTTRQYSVDFDAAWQPGGDADLQIDGGVNLGLNRATPGLQIYLGLTRRF